MVVGPFLWLALHDQPGFIWIKRYIFNILQRDMETGWRCILHLTSRPTAGLLALQGSPMMVFEK
jgi:hypothetical protein